MGCGAEAVDWSIGYCCCCCCYQDMYSGGSDGNGDGDGNSLYENEQSSSSELMTSYQLEG